MARYRRVLLSVVVGLSLVLTIAPAWAENSVVVVERTNLAPGSTVEIRLKITNDVALRTIVVPLVLRKETGDAYVTAVKPAWRERLSLPGSPLSDIVYINHYLDGGDGTCKRYLQSEQPDLTYGHRGFRTITHPEIANDTTSRAIDSGLVGYLFARYLFFLSDTLSPGADMEGSLLLEVVLNDEEGCFLIDTTCTDPANHFGMVAPDNVLVPDQSFTSGLICISPCACPYQSDFDEDEFVTTLDMAALIDVLFASGTDPQDSLCWTTRGDFDCDGFTTALDMSGLIDHLFAGGPGPCDPCE